MISVVKSPNKAIIKSYMRTFVASVLAVVSYQLQTNSGNMGSLFTLQFAYGALGAGVLAILGPLARWLDTSDKSFGRAGN